MLREHHLRDTRFFLSTRSDSGAQKGVAWRSTTAKALNRPGLLRIFGGMKLPYGISHFPTLVQDGYYYVDKTPYLAQMEEAPEKYVFFLRPRRFGKSLFVSLLEHYYGQQHRDRFDALFGAYHVGQQPTPLANRYQVLKFDFSRIDTATHESTFRGFFSNVKSGVRMFAHTYGFTVQETQQALEAESPDDMLKILFDLIRIRGSEKVYLLIDEYDHFANELIAFDFSNFGSFVTRNGFVRKFYEAIKTGTGEGVVDRLFVTGVSPITLDSLTSGFNIAAHLSTSRLLNELMGFTEAEVVRLFEVACPGQEISLILDDLRKWYNGYLFNQKAPLRVYNSDMILYFLKEYQKNQCQEYPDKIVDVNIASDYGKIRRLFSVKDKAQNYRTLEKLIKEGQVTSLLTQQFSFEKRFDEQDFVSLLFYLGFITIEREELGQLVFRTPNYVITQLFSEYFIQLIDEQASLSASVTDIQGMVIKMAQENDVQPFIQLIEQTLQGLSNRDFIRFDEKYIKVLFVGFANLANLYYVKSEPEVGQKYVDVLFLYRPPHFPKYQFVFEIKYLKKKDAARLNTVREEAVAQLRGYLGSPELQAFINRPGRGMETVRAYVVVFVGEQAQVVEEIQDR